MKYVFNTKAATGAKIGGGLVAVTGDLFNRTVRQKGYFRQSASGFLSFSPPVLEGVTQIRC